MAKPFQYLPAGRQAAGRLTRGVLEEDATEGGAVWEKCMCISSGRCHVATTGGYPFGIHLAAEGRW